MEHKIETPLFIHEEASREVGSLLFIPTRDYVANLKVGDLAPDSFGRPREVVEITYRGEDVNGLLFVCYYTRHSATSRISHALKENELDRNAATSRYFTSRELCRIESAFHRTEVR